MSKKTQGFNNYFKKMAKEINLKESHINNSNLNYQGLPSNGYFVLMCQKFFLNKTTKKVRHYHNNCLELVNSCLFLWWIYS